MLCVLFAVYRLLAMLHLRYGRLGSHLTLRAFCLCLYLYLLVTNFVFSFCPHYGVGRLHVLHPVNREAVPLVHALCIFCVFCFSLFTLLSFERESSETILLFSDSGGSEVGECENNTQVTVLV